MRCMWRMSLAQAGIGKSPMSAGHYVFRQAEPSFDMLILFCHGSCVCCLPRLVLLLVCLRLDLQPLAPLCSTITHGVVQGVIRQLCCVRLLHQLINNLVALCMGALHHCNTLLVLLLQSLHLGRQLGGLLLEVGMGAALSLTPAVQHNQLVLLHLHLGNIMRSWVLESVLSFLKRLLSLL